MYKHINEIVFYFFLIFLHFMQHVYAMLLVYYSFKCRQHFVFCDIHIRVLIVQTQGFLEQMHCIKIYISYI